MGMCLTWLSTCPLDLRKTKSKIYKNKVFIIIMIIFLYGEDLYRKKEKEKEIVSGYKEKHKSGINLKYFDCSKGDFSIKEIRLQSSQVSMFKEKKLYIFYNPFSKKEEFLKELKNFEKSEDVFLFIDEKMNEKDKLFKELKEKSSSQEFSFLGGLKLKNWVKKEFEKFGKKIKETEINYFILSVGSDLWLAHNEINKIANFSEKEEITKEDIETFLKKDIKNDIFKTIDAMGEKNKKTAIKLIRFHLEKGENPLYLLSMIIYQFRNILIIKDFITRGENYNSAFKKAKIHPFVFRKTYAQSLKFDLSELKKIYKKLLDVDLKIKTGKGDKEIEIELFVAGI